MHVFQPCSSDQKHRDGTCCVTSQNASKGRPAILALPFKEPQCQRFRLTISPKRSVCFFSPLSDIDECLTNPHQCNNVSNAQCINTVGSHQCMCQVGYTGGGNTTCTGKENLFSHTHRHARTQARKHVLLAFVANRLGREKAGHVVR